MIAIGHAESATFARCAKRVVGVLHTPGRRALADLRSDRTGQSVLQHENQAGS